MTNNIKGFYGNVAEYNQSQIGKIFREEAILRGSKAAIRFSGQEMSYSELEQRSNMVSNCIKSRGVKLGDSVGILFERGFDMIVSILGILKLGCRYVPLDPSFPTERLNYMMSLANVDLILFSNVDLKLKHEGLDQSFLDFSSFNQFSSIYKLPQNVTSNDAAYVMFTSGTTGRPKGIEVTQDNILKLVFETGPIQIEHTDRILQWSNYAFDGCIYEIFGCLLKGATLQLISEFEAPHALELSRVIETEKVTVSFVTTALFNSLIDFDPFKLKGLRKLLFGGEMVSVSHVSRAFKALGDNVIIHVYGPTETTVYATYFPINSMEQIGNTVPIGYALDNTEIFILNEALNYCSVGEEGELYIGGSGVSNGYLKNSELTDEKFILNQNGDGKLYKTGDLGRFLHDGAIEFIGRSDSQVKIRGYRIELGEIESVLETQDGILKSVVLAISDKTGQKQLIAYYTGNQKLNEGQLKLNLKSKLPEYMIPIGFVNIDLIPLTNNGKIARKELPEFDFSTLNSTNYEGPRNETEIEIVKIWKDILAQENIGINDNFFLIGGHSLLATKMITTIESKLKVRIGIKDIFNATTIKKISELIQNREKISDCDPILKVERGDNTPLSFAQERLWIEDQINGSSHYHIPLVCEISKGIDLNVLENALQLLIERHEVLRTVLTNNENGVSQSIMTSGSWNITRYSNVTDEYIMNELIVKPFDLSTDYMLRCGVKIENEEPKLLAFVFHHIAFDGWSIPIFVKELNRLYDCELNGHSACLDVLPIQYADYSIWERRKSKIDEFDQKILFWKNKLANVPTLSLPLDYSRPIHQSTVGKNVSFNISQKQLDKLEDYAHKAGITVFMALLSIYKVLLSKYSGGNDICVGIPIANRRKEELSSLIGFFVNALPIRTQQDAEQSFSDFTLLVKEEILFANKYQDVPFVKILKELFEGRSMSISPVFQTMFSVWNEGDFPNLKLGKEEYIIENIKSETSKFDISLNGEYFGEGMRFTIEYCSKLFKGSTIESLGSHFVQLLEKLIENPEKPLKNISLLSNSEQIRIDKFKGKEIKYPSDSIGVQFREQSKIRGSKAALVFQGNEMSYSELETKSNQISNFLKGRGIKRGDSVGILFHRGFEMMQSIIGVLKLGAKYVPMDPSLPIDRLQYMMELAVVEMILYSDEALRFKKEIIGLKYEHIKKSIHEDQKFNVLSDFSSNDAAYVMFTSGTTGQPKGIEVSQDNILKLVFETGPIQIEHTDRVLQWSNYAFDGCIYEIFGCLLKGATLQLISEFEAPHALELSRIIETENVTVSFVTTALFNSLIDFDPSKLMGLRKLLFGGEMVSVSHVARAFQTLGDNVLIHVYGPTETTVYATYFPIDSMDSIGHTIPIGYALDNTQIYILDKRGNMLPIGIEGEIYIGGRGVSNGYLQNEVLSSDRFIDNPYGSDKLYKSGDLGRFLSDGAVEFIGREDSQVKIRGYRIELAEIASVLREQEGLDKAVVLTQEDANGQNQIIAYVTGKGEINQEELKLGLKSKLPSYMIPLGILKIPIIPLTSNGKIDRTKLPELSFTNTKSSKFSPATDATEAKLVEIWEELLGSDGIGILDDFFEVGGHSLLATKLATALEKKFNVEIGIKDLFAVTTIKELAVFINNQDQLIELTKIEKKARPVEIPLSFAQERLWFVDQMSGSTHYHIPVFFRLDNGINVSVLEGALKSLVERQEILRTVLQKSNRGVHQKLLSSDNWTMGRETDITEESFINQLVYAAFDLSEDYMLRCSIKESEGNPELFGLVLHHIAGDGWSLPILFKELNELYKKGSAKEPMELEEMPIQYADYSIWERENLKGEALTKKISYWEDKLSGVGTLNLPLDYSRPVHQSTEGRYHSFDINKDLKGSLEKYSRKEGMTMFMTLLTSYKILLSKYTGSQDICVGIPLANRRQSELTNLIGFFVNALPIRTSQKEESSFSQYGQIVKEEILNANIHQDVPFEKIVEEVVSDRSTSITPIYQTMFSVLNDGDIPNLKIGENEYALESFIYETSKFDISLSGSPLGEGMRFTIEYCSKLFKASTIESLGNHFVHLIERLVESPEAPLKSISLLSNSEKIRIDKFKGKEIKYPSDSIGVQFREQSKIRGSKAALVFQGNEMSYSELETKSNQISNFLKGRGIKRGDSVGILFHRGFEMMQSIVGILKIGAKYVPMDPNLPIDRLRYMMDLADVKTILYSDEALRSDNEIEGLSYENIIESNDEEKLFEILLDVSSEDMAYVMFTSGTTGQPKGIGVSQDNILKLVYDTGAIRVLSEDKVLQWSNYAFDTCIYEMFSSLLLGATLQLIHESEVPHALELCRIIEEEKITVSFLTAALFNSLIDHDPTQLKGIRKLLAGGESLSVPHVKRAYEVLGGGKLVNGYGPTEATVFATYYPIDSLDNIGNSVPIGYALDNTQIYILDKEENMLPIGIEGEIYIGGRGVSAGYLQNEELTKGCFIDNPYGEGKLYKTGDLGRFLAGGEVEFLGREDGQVKIHGFRIEIAEIESVLGDQEGIEKTVVLIQEDVKGQKHIIAYVTSDESIDQEELKMGLKSKLPSFMIPLGIVKVDSIPLTTNGKADKKKLPKFNFESIKTTQYSSPTNDTEAKLVEIWEELLGNEEIGIYDNFFEIGGHSLLATRLATKIEKEFNVTVGIKELFEATTIKELAIIVDNQDQLIELTKIEKKARPVEIPLSFAQERLWFVDQMSGSTHYHIPVFFRLDNGINVSVLEGALKSLVERQEILRTVLQKSNRGVHQKLLSSDNWTMGRETDITEESFINQLVYAAFDLSEDYMLRCSIKESEGNPELFGLVLHHIAGDGWSLPILFKELNELYKKGSAKEPMELEEMPIQYADYSIWERENLKGEALTKKISYWEDKLSGVGTLNLPLDYSRPVHQSTEGRYHSFDINKDLKGSLEKYSRKEGMTMFMTLLTSYKILLSKYTGSQDICVGIPLANRRQSELTNLIGFFVNALPIRTSQKEESSFSQYGQIVKEEILNANIHQDVPFEKIVEEVVSDRSTSITPIYQTMFSVLNDGDIPNLKIGENEYALESFIYETSKFDISLSGSPLGEGMRFTIEYCSKLFKASTIESLGNHFVHLIERLVESPEAPLKSISLLSNSEKIRIDKFKGKEIKYPSDSIGVQFREQSKIRGSKAALVFQGNEMSYSELETKSNQISNFLKGRGIKRGDSVGILFHRGFEMMQSIVGILKIGAKYVPMDPNLPIDRLRYMMDLADVKTILYSDEALRSDNEIEGLSYENIIESNDEEKLFEILLDVSSEDMAYVMFTSGTTGQPKGIGVSQDNILKLVYDTGAIRVLSEDKVLQWSNYAFDTCIYEMFSSLLLGATLQLIHESEVPHALELCRIIEEEKITVSFLTAALFNSLIDHDPTQLKGIRKLLAGGESLSVPHVKRAYEVLGGGKLVNGYGPTEATVFATYYPIDSLDNIGNSVPIGYALDNTQIYILDKEENMLPIGIEGEIYIGGRGVSAGYLQNEELTKGCFIDNPYGEGKLYKTGDLGRFLAGGEVEFLGREDGQVKIHGFRIEIAEIESVLGDQEGIEKTVVLIQEDVKGQKHIIAYVTSDESIDQEELKMGLKSKLPSFMIPLGIVKVDSIPLTTNGKADKKKLPKFNFESIKTTQYSSPTNDTEAKLVEIWEELLGNEEIGIYDNFFEIGGHSLLATRLATAIEKEFKLNIKINLLFELNQVSQLAKYIILNMDDYTEPSVENDYQILEIN